MVLLKETITSLCPERVLTADERNRNRIGKVFCYTWDEAMKETLPSFNRDIGLPDITNCNSRVDVLEETNQTHTSFKPELVPGTQIPYPGFPSLNVLPIESAELISIGLNCFGMISKYPNTILRLHKMPQLPSAAELADNILGRSLFVNWPMMHEAKVTTLFCFVTVLFDFRPPLCVSFYISSWLYVSSVKTKKVVAVSDANCEVRMLKKQKKVRLWKSNEANSWESVSVTMAQQYLNGSGVPGSGGVDIGDIQIRLKLVPLQGMKTSPANGATKKLFGKEEADIPLQMALWKAPAPDPRFIERGPMTLKNRYCSGIRVILTKGKHRGCLGTVLGVVDSDKVGVKVEVWSPEPPFGLAIAKSVQETYISSADAAKVLQMNPGVFGKITGNLYFEPGRYDLGLNLKYKENLCVQGYTRKKPRTSSDKGTKSGDREKAWLAGDSLLVVGSKRTDDESDKRTIWEYTPKAVRLVAAYKQKYPQLFAALARYPNERKYDARNVFGSKGNDTLTKIRDWLNNVETAKIPRIPSNTESMPIMAIAAVQRAADVRKAAQERQNLKDVNIKIPASALYQEGSTAATDVLIASSLSESSAPELGDRIVNLCANGVPFGARGTVVSIHDPAEGCVELVMDEEFIGGSTLQGSCANFRGKLCVWNHLLRICAADSKDVVDQLISTSSFKAVIDTIEDNNHQGQISSTPRHISSSYETVSASNVKPPQRRVPDQNDALRKGPELEMAVTPSKQGDALRKSPLREKREKTGTPQEVTTQPNSVGTIKPSSASGARGGKQGVWKEAVGPDGSGTGFKGVGRGGISGFQAWRRHLSSNGPVERKNPILAKSSKTVSTVDGGVGSISAGLKALLGVKTETSTSVAVSDEKDASAGLKAMLGVTVNDTAVMPPPPLPPPPHPATAADALLELMMKEQSASPAPAIPAHQPSHQSFNFTYVKEGEEAQPPPTPYSQMVSIPPHNIGVEGFMSQPMINPQMMMSFGGTPAMVHGPIYDAAPVVKREKKAKKLEGSSQNIVPSLVATKIKEEG